MSLQPVAYMAENYRSYYLCPLKHQTFTSETFLFPFHTRNASDALSLDPRERSCAKRRGGVQVTVLARLYSSAVVYKIGLLYLGNHMMSGTTLGSCQNSEKPLPTTYGRGRKDPRCHHTLLSRSSGGTEGTGTRKKGTRQASNSKVSSLLSSLSLCNCPAASSQTLSWRRFSSFGRWSRSCSQALCRPCQGSSGGISSSWVNQR